MPKQINPRPNHVVLKRVPKEDVKVNGLIIPNSAQKEVDLYQVVAAGLQLDGTDSGLEAGQVVILDKYVGNSIWLDNEEYTLVKGGDIVGTVA